MQEIIAHIVIAFKEVGHPPADFVAALPAGEHTIGIVSANGTATAAFIIKEKPAADNSSDTGDNTSLPLLIGLMLLSIAGITGMTGCRRRKRADE